MLASLRTPEDLLDHFEAVALGDMEQLRTLEGDDEERLSVDGFSADGFTALGLRSYFGHSQVVGCLLTRRANPNLLSRNALGVATLHSALACQHTGIVRSLLSHGANPNLSCAAGWAQLPYCLEGNHAELAL